MARRTSLLRSAGCPLSRRLKSRCSQPPSGSERRFWPRHERERGGLIEAAAPDEVDVAPAQGLRGVHAEADDQPLEVRGVRAPEARVANENELHPRPEALEEERAAPDRRTRSWVHDPTLPDLREVLPAKDVTRRRGKETDLAHPEVARLVPFEPHCPRIDRGDAPRLGPYVAIAWEEPGVLPMAEDDVAGGDGRSVAPARAGSNLQRYRERVTGDREARYEVRAPPLRARL